MMESFKTTGLVAVLVSSIMMIAFILSSPSQAGEFHTQAAQPLAQTQMATAPMKLALGLKAPTRQSRKKCNGKTTDDCCKGLSNCSCLYMPGSSSTNHPTACFATKKKSNSRS